MPAIAASGANTTTTWTMSGCRGSPLNSMGWYTRIGNRWE